MTPVFDDEGKDVCSTWRHADIMPISAASRRAQCRPIARRSRKKAYSSITSILVADGRLREAETIDLFQSARYPVRNVVQNLGDLKAQIAANEKGDAELRRMVSSSVWRLWKLIWVTCRKCGRAGSASDRRLGRWRIHAGVGQRREDRSARQY